MAGHQVAAVLPSVLDLTAQIERTRPDIILIETDSPSRDTLENLAVMDRDMPRPVIILTSDDDSDIMRAAFRAGVSAYVVDNLDMARLKPIIDVAIARFESHQSVKQELAAATRKLSERKVVERAKGILMKTAASPRMRLRGAAQARDGTFAAAGESRRRPAGDGPAIALSLVRAGEFCTAAVRRALAEGSFKAPGRAAKPRQSRFAVPSDQSGMESA
jgi:response regulator of citrate/malate metabolism